MLPFVALFLFFAIIFVKSRRLKEVDQTDMPLGAWWEVIKIDYNDQYRITLKRVMAPFRFRQKIVCIMSQLRDEEKFKFKPFCDGATTHIRFEVVSCGEGKSAYDFDWETFEKSNPPKQASVRHAHDEIRWLSGQTIGPASRI